MVKNGPKIQKSGKIKKKYLKIHKNQKKIQKSQIPEK